MIFVEKELLCQKQTSKQKTSKEKQHNFILNAIFERGPSLQSYKMSYNEKPCNIILLKLIKIITQN